MLLADLHGKRVAEAQGNEDYLTSTVFGHLRYLPCSVFWEELFSRTISTKANADGSLSSVIKLTDNSISQYESLVIDFWINHPEYGEPDLILKFRSRHQRPLDILIEAKLFAGKSSYGENDQLVKYMKLLDDLPNQSPPHTPDSRCMVYLTQVHAQAEAEESLEIASSQRMVNHDIFRLRWQDIAAVAKKAALLQAEPARTILQDVARYLARRGLEPFDGFHELKDVPEIIAISIRAEWQINAGMLFREVSNLEMIHTEAMGWLA